MQTFCQWLEWHHYATKKTGPVVPQADRVMHLIQQAGQQGISRCDLGAAIKLDRETLDDQLAALADSGWITVSMEGDFRVYRAR